MEYFTSHILYIVIAAVVIALVAFLTVFLAEKNESERNINEEKCNGRCGSCSNFDICMKPEKKVIGDN